LRFGTRGVAATILGLSVIIAGCRDVSGPTNYVDAHALWIERGPVNYEMTLHIACECPAEMRGPVIMTVRNGVVESRQYASTRLPVIGYEEWFPTVDGLFKKVETALRENRPAFHVEYARDTGYPTRIETSGIAQIDVYTVSVTAL